MRPLADEIRPQTLDEVAGQKHLLGEGALLRRLIESGAEANLIFYGPSGTGKTTIANIIARRTKKTLYHLNATTASLQDVKAIIGDVDTMMAPNGVLLYLDEIQYFNKKQQQSLLEFMENGKITLIASTTENPFFYVYNALLSRSTVFEFKALTPEETVPAVERALALQQQRSSLPLSWEEEVPRLIAAGCGGDVRKAVNAVELLYQSAKPRDGGLLLTTEDAQVLAQRSAMRYDREGDQHYDLLSALQKSIRGSDPDAAVYYLGRLLAAGDLLSPCRRLLVMAAEDVGLAYPQAMAVTKACVDAARELGLPEYLVMRQPFPGPGLAIRVIGEVTKDKLDTLRLADFIFRDEIAKAKLEGTMNQYFAVLTNMRSVGVQGDGRTYDYTLALRSVTTTDFMTADWTRIPYEVLDRVSVRIVNEVPNINRIVYDITSKPPATIEWE